MKNPLTALLPALALLALGGCAGTAALSSSEDDGVYYSSQDRTTAVVSAAPAPASTDEAANPDYNGNTERSSARQRNSGGSDQYYDDTYTYMQGVPAYGPGLGYYTPYSPYTSLGYASGWGGGGYGFSPYGAWDPFYSPFYGPFGYGYGSGVSISLGFGRPWGYGGLGYGGFGRYGYGGGFYDPFFYSSPFYGGYYGRGGYYGNNFGNGYYGGNSGYGNRYYSNDGGRNSRPASGPRRDRSAEGRYSAGSVNNNPSVPVTGGSPTGGRMRSEGRVAPSGGTASQPMAPAPVEGRTRTEGLTVAPAAEATPVRAENGYNRPQRMSRSEQPVYRDMTQPADAGQVLIDQSRGRRRNPDVVTERDQMQPQMQPQAQPQESQRRRGGFLQNVVTQPSNDGGQVVEQSRRQRAYDQPRPERTVEQPQQRSYEQPQQRSYEQPQRSSQPSYSAPSNSGGGGGRGRAD